MHDVQSELVGRRGVRLQELLLETSTVGDRGGVRHALLGPGHLCNALPGMN